MIQDLRKRASKLILTAVVATMLAPAMTFAGPATQTLNDPQEPPLNITNSGFKLLVCDGPDLSELPTGTQVYVNGHEVTLTKGQPVMITETRQYVPCDFNGAMLQIQHLINIAMIAGVIVAILGFSYAGFLYITSGADPGKRSQANGIFRNIGIGFIIMLSAWFIVYQILAWLTGSSGFGALLGKP